MSGNPVAGVKRPMANGNEGSTPALGDAQALRDEARSAGRFDAAISAEQKRALALGYYVQRSESGKPGNFTTGMTVERIDQEIARITTQAAIRKPQSQKAGAHADPPAQ